MVHTSLLSLLSLLVQLRHPLSSLLLSRLLPRSLISFFSSLSLHRTRLLPLFQPTKPSLKSFPGMIFRTLTRSTQLWG